MNLLNFVLKPDCPPTKAVLPICPFTFWQTTLAQRSHRPAWRLRRDQLCLDGRLGLGESQVFSRRRQFLAPGCWMLPDARNFGGALPSVVGPCVRPRGPEMLRDSNSPSYLCWGRPATGLARASRIQNSQSKGRPKESKRKKQGGPSCASPGYLTSQVVSTRGFALQITSQLAECSKNLIGEVVMSGAGLKPPA